MRFQKAILAAVLMAFAVPVPSDAQSREEAVSIEAAAWLAGRWVGGGPMGEAESSWSSPFAGQMVGHYTLRTAERVIFYELMVLDVHEGGLRLSVKHFQTDFTSWEPGDQ